MCLVDEFLKVGGSGSDNSMQWTFFMNPLLMTIWTKSCFSLRTCPSLDQTSPYLSWHRLLLAHEGHVEVQDGKLLALLLKRAGVGKGGWQLKAPFSCWNISYQLLWFCCLTRNLINSGVCKSSPTNLTTELPEDFRSHPFPLHKFTPFRQHLFPHVKNFAGHKPEAAELVPRFAISWFFFTILKT